MNQQAGFAVHYAAEPATGAEKAADKIIQQ
jgi:hypothetical protein